MGTFKGASICEQRIYRDMLNPETSDYDVKLPVTVPEAVIDPATGKTLAQILGEISAEIENQKKLIMTVDLTNTEEDPLWFNNSAKTVAFPEGKNRVNLDYTVQWEQVSVTGGSLGDVTISEKQLNGFTIAYDGTATAVTLKLYIQGGML